MDALAIVCREEGRMAVEKISVAEPKSGQLRVKILACGVCHTDSAARAGIIPVPRPVVLGHEGVGIVESIGAGVRGFEVGDRVIIAFPSCGHCQNCLDGRPYACEELNRLFFTGELEGGERPYTNEKGEAIGAFFAQGSFSQYVLCDARNAVPVREEVDITLLCSLACGVNTGAGAVLNRLDPKPGDSVAVFGCGGVGMAAIMAARIAGCSKVIAVDVVRERLELALELGATDAVNSAECDCVEKIKEITGGGADGSIECTGVPVVVQAALKCLARCGTCVLCSVTGEAEVPIALEPMLMNPSVTLAGLTEGGSNPATFLPRLVRYYKEGRLPVDRLVEFYDFRDFERAFEDSHSGKVIKPVLKF